MVHEHIVNGEVMYLVQPVHAGAKWTQTNKIFRSSLWNAEGELVSAGFPKFTNWGENPEVFPLPETLDGCTVVEKLDGSLLIVSKYKGHFILRTRGTVDASKLENGHELQLFKATILPKLDEFYSKSGRNIGIGSWDSSILFEWTSPVQKIILSYGDTPQWTLIGVVGHEDYSLSTQSRLNDVASWLGLHRPVCYNFPSITDLLQNVEQWKGREGVCIYSNNDQTIHKVKSVWYLALHHMKSELSSFEKVLDVWLNMGRPDYQTFYNTVAKQFDFELANQIRGDMSKICDAYKEVQKIEAHMYEFINNLRVKYPTVDSDKKVRGMAARNILDAYGNTNRSTFLFKILDGKPLNSEDIKKLIFQVLK